MNRKFLTQFTDKILNFPNWVKAIIYEKLSEEVAGENPICVFAAYKPVLSYKGRCELDYKDTGFDTNIYNILKLAGENYSISEIVFDTYFSLEEVAGYILFCIDAGYFEVPQNQQIMNIAGTLCGKYRTGEYFYNSGYITEAQLNSAIETFNSKTDDLKFGQMLVGLGMISDSLLNSFLVMKDEAKKRFIIDSGDVPNIHQEFSAEADMYKLQINSLKEKNIMLQKKLEQLLAMVKNDDK